MAPGKRNRNRLAYDTAEAMAALRAASACEHDESLRNPDHLAAAFLSLRPRLTTLVKLPVLRRMARPVAEALLPGGYWFEIARVKHVDAVMRSELRDGLSQLVILGAGFDTRAYRFADELEAVRVYEVDHPATARVKRERVTRLLGRLPRSVTYLDVDFMRNDLSVRLAAVGYDWRAPTLLIASGLAAYLPEPIFAHLLRFCAAHGSPRTSIVFDYIYADLLDGNTSYYGAAQLLKRIDALTEPLHFGIPAGTSGAFLARHSLTLGSDIGPGELASRYLRRTNGTIAGRPYGFASIAHARVLTDQTTAAPA